MSVLCVGVSHKSAGVEVLEQVAPDQDSLPKLYDELLTGDSVSEALVLSTCNRVEVYAEVDKFHAGLQHVSQSMAMVAGTELATLTPHLYVHYDDRAVAHLFSVAAGLDSMVVGETQILGQLRHSFRQARELGTIGRSLGDITEHALRVGKRVHTDTAIDRAGHSVVGAGLGLAAEHLGELTTKSVVVLGAGSMSSLAVSLLQRSGVAAITVVNRGRARAARLAGATGVATQPLDQLGAAVAGADLLVCCTGATRAIVDSETLRGRAPGRDLFVLDLALPRDVAPAVRAVSGVTVVDLESLQGVAGADPRDVDAARAIVAEEVLAHLTARRSARVAPTVAALRAKADQVVAVELLRLAGRLPDLDQRGREEVASTVRRVVDKLLHAPTVRVKELAGVPGGDSYAEALRELFDLDPGAPDAVTKADVVGRET
jgi:glutamyl-tRNA reductase